MPYIAVQGTLHKCDLDLPLGYPPDTTTVSGLKDSDKTLLTRFNSTLWRDGCTITYLHPPMAILTALEIIGYKVVACVSLYAKITDEQCYMWTMRKDFSEPEPLECAEIVG